MDELREKYLQGKMSEAEKKAFEKGLSPQEKQELAAELGIRAGLESSFRNELRDKVAGFEAQGKRVRRLNPAYIGIAASLFLVASFMLYFKGDQKSLFDQYYEVHPNFELTTVRGNEDPTTREKAYAAYDIGDFSGALAAFNQLDSMQNADYFFRGVSLIQLTEYKKALADFDVVINQKDKDYEVAATWYTALIHLKSENKEFAIPLLKTLSEGESEFAEISQKLLAQL
ncbi:tetratricopeptide repeat protein [Ekhidna sp.]|uniref:tetratricopeptide repeat protein n=1 Tax=Ekhidna sp. TaxID=2608089 RepID=UPI003BAC355B